ncbi:MAG: Hsp20 family protein [Candidatus Omnitrophica bacterium]|nr:Hsp20 family protein [Candidatus Omnitrophota bacterium]MDE2223313.1 Hsp20 family protein [Candidatus Omnitrophota bacterium]
MRKGCVALVAGMMILGTGLTNPQAWADETSQLKQQVDQLQEKVNQLQAQLAGRQQAVPLAEPQYTQWQWEDPFAQMMLMQQHMENRMQQAFGNTEGFTPRMDMRKTPQQYIITMDIPGMDKNKINVETKQDMLVVSGERQKEEENKGNAGNQYYRQERVFGSFLQVVPLPEDADKSKVNADYKNGVLTITIDRIKGKGQKPGSQKIQVK